MSLIQIPTDQPYSVHVFKVGSDYIARTRDGKILSSGTNATTVLQAGLNGLTAGRTWKERIKLQGDFSSVTTMNIPSFTIVDCTDARIFQANAANINLMTNSDPTNGNTDIEIIGGIIDGNKANQTPNGGAGIENYQARNTIHLQKVTHAVVRDVYIINSNGVAVNFRDCTNFVGTRNRIITPFKIAFFATDGQYGQWVRNYVKGPRENFASTFGCEDVLIADNFGDGDGQQLSTGINTAHSLRNKIIRNWVINAGTTAIVSSVEVDAIGTDTQIIDNIIIDPNQGGIICNTNYASDNLVIKGNKVYGKTTPTVDSYGIRVASGSRHRIEGNYVTNFKLSGILVQGNNVVVLGKDFLNEGSIVSNNHCWNNGRAVGGAESTRAGISLKGDVQDYLKNTLAQNNVCYDTAGAAGTQLYGIHYQGTLNVTIIDNNVNGNVTQGIIATGTNNAAVVENNIGDSHNAHGLLHGRKKYGVMLQVPANDALVEGLLVGHLTAVGTASAVTDFTSPIKDTWIRRSTGTVSGTPAGHKTSSRWYRGHNLIFRGRFRITNTTNDTVFIGLKSGADASITGDDMLNALSGIGIGWRSTDANFTILHNDGTGVTAATALSPTKAKDTLAHTFEIRANDAQTRFEVRLDDNPFQNITSDIAAQGTALALIGQVRNTAAEDKGIDNFWWEIEVDRV